MIERIRIALAVLSGRPVLYGWDIEGIDSDDRRTSTLRLRDKAILQARWGQRPRIAEVSFR